MTVTDWILIAGIAVAWYYLSACQTLLRSILMQVAKLIDVTDVQLAAIKLNTQRDD